MKKLINEFGDDYWNTVMWWNWEYRDIMNLNNLGGKEPAFNWNIKPTDRSWIITQGGVIRGGINHRTILKRFFTKEWHKLKNDNKDDSEIEKLLEERFLNLQMIYVGELTDLYIITLRLNKSERNLIQCFVKSFLLNHNDFKDRNISIQIYKGKSKKYKIHQIVTDGDACLCELAKTLPPYNKE